MQLDTAEEESLRDRACIIIACYKNGEKSVKNVTISLKLPLFEVHIQFRCKRLRKPAHITVASSDLLFFIMCLCFHNDF